MKQQNLIYMTIANPASSIYANRDEWALEIIREPRPSCLGKWAIRNDLRRMLPGERRWIGGVWVTKIDSAHKATRYLIDNRQYAFDDAIAAIENPPPVQPAITLVQLELPLERETA